MTSFWEILTPLSEAQNDFLYCHPELYLRNPFLDEVEWVSSIEEVD
jgi:hypothetical protein